MHDPRPIDEATPAAKRKTLGQENRFASQSRSSDRYCELESKHNDRTCRAPHARLDGERAVLEITRAAGCLEDDAAHLVFNGSLGSTDKAFADGLVLQLANVTVGRDAADPQCFGFALAVVQGIEPRDEVEGMLAAQMAAIHIAMMSFARKLKFVETIPQQDSAERTLNKLARTFAAQAEALKRYRTGGEQKVTVQHVTVNEGGQAMVGTVTTRGGGAKRMSGNLIRHCG